MATYLTQVKMKKLANKSTKAVHSPPLGLFVRPPSDHSDTRRRVHHQSKKQMMPPIRFGAEAAFYRVMPYSFQTEYRVGNGPSGWQKSPRPAKTSVTLVDADSGRSWGGAPATRP